ncbi:MAG: DUF4159 domain-containing protein [Acidobacteria bacterium]|nr:DUF4159 domain-containing protein [Acidobacteriota bacterium]
MRSQKGRGQRVAAALILFICAWLPQRSAADPDMDEATQFTFARIHFSGTSGGWYGVPGWAHDYPRAERNFLKILAESTGIRTSAESFRVVRFDDQAVFDYPWVYISEPGSMRLTPREVENFREYIRRGGFVMVDDFDGPYDWMNWNREFKQVFPDRELVELTIDHPIWHCFFDIKALDMIPPRWAGKPEFWAMMDEGRRVQIIANFNNDIGDYWEWSDTDAVPIELSNEAYKFGINYVIYALTH